jgi:hypothetical protein
MARRMSLFRKLFGGGGPEPPQAGDSGPTIVPPEAASLIDTGELPAASISAPFEVGPFPGPFQLIGFTLAHAALTASELKDATPLMPLAVIQREGKALLSRFTGETQFDAITSGKAYMNALAGSAEIWAFARDGLWSGEAVPRDAISVDFWVKGMNTPATIVQPYEPYVRHQRFRLLGDPKLIAQGKVRDDEKAVLTVATILKGIDCHVLVAPLWPRWKRAPEGGE